MKKTKLEKGITLVALIITIVVLLILAVVSIGAVRNSGIIGHATNTKSESTVAEEKEIVTLAENEWQLQKNTSNNVEDFKTAIETALKNETENGKVESITGEDAGPLTITFSKTGNKYTITADGAISTGGKILGKWSERGLEKVILDTKYCGFSKGVDPTYFEITFTSDGSVVLKPDSSDSSENSENGFISNQIDEMIISNEAGVNGKNIFWINNDGSEWQFIFSDDGRKVDLQISGNVFAESMSVDYEGEDYSVAKTRIYISKEDSNSGIILNEDGYWYPTSNGKIDTSMKFKYEFKENVEINITNDSGDGYNEKKWRCLVWSETETGGSRYAYMFGIVQGGTELYFIDSLNGDVIDGTQTYRRFSLNSKIGTYVLDKNKTLADFTISE